MKEKEIVVNFRKHFTHTDSDGLGCAIVYYGLINDAVSLKALTNSEQIVIDTSFNGIYNIDKNVNEFIDIFETGSATFMMQIINNDFVMASYNGNIIDDQFVSTHHFDVYNKQIIETLKNSSVNFDEPVAVTFVCNELLVTDLPLSLETIQRMDKSGVHCLYIDHHASNPMGQVVEWSHVYTSGCYSATAYLWDWIIDHERIASLMISAKRLYDKPMNPNQLGNDINRSKYISETIDSLKRFGNEIDHYDTGKWLPEDGSGNFHEKTDYYPTAYIHMLGGIREVYNDLIRSFDSSSTEMTIGSILNNVEHTTAIKIYDAKRDYIINKCSRSIVYCQGSDLPEILNGDEYKDMRIGVYVADLEYQFETTYTLSYPNIHDPKNFDKPLDLLVMLFPDTKTLGFRHGTRDYDLSKIATENGGGGHFNASGCKLDTEKFLKILSTYYRLKDEKENTKR